jgi:serine/threonine protein kinase
MSEHPTGPGQTLEATVASGDPLPPLGGRYQVQDEIARGGMGVIYRATDTALDREVAVKVLQERYTPDSIVARRFLDEARITAQLQHPGIPAVHDLGTLPDGRPFLAMKLIRTCRRNRPSAPSIRSTPAPTCSGWAPSCACC